MARSQTTAYLIPSEQITKRRVSISTRPMKLAFIINENISKKELVKYFEYNTAIWGGYYSLLVPTDGQSVREDWWQTLLHHDPDLIIAHGEIDSTLIKKVESQIQPYHVWQWKREQLLREVPPNTDYFDNILMQDILRYEDEVKYTPPAQFQLRVPQIPKDCCYYEYASVQFGLFPERTREMFMERLQGLSVEFKNDDFYSYLQYIEKLETQSSPTERILTPIVTTRSGLRAIGGGIENNSSKAFKTFIVLAGEYGVTDFCLFWNLRMQSNLGHSKEILIIPFSVFEEHHNIQILAEWCNQLWNWHNHLVLASVSLEEEQLLNFREQLMPYLKEKIETVDIWCQHFVTKGIQIQHKIRDTEELTFRDGIFHLHLPPSTFVESALQSRWVTDIHIENDGLDFNGFLPPKYDGLNKLLSNDPYQGMNPFNPGFSTRLANNFVNKKVLAYRTYCTQTQLTGKLPTTEEIFVSLLDNKGNDRGIYHPLIPRKQNHKKTPLPLQTCNSYLK